MASSSLSYDSDASLVSYDSDDNIDSVSKEKIPLPFIKPKEYPHYIIVGHGQVNSMNTFTNMTHCKINYFCRRGGVMLAYLHDRAYFIDQMQKTCEKRIVVKEDLSYGEEIDNTEYIATNVSESRLFGIYSCNVLDSPIFRFELNTIYTLETLLNFLSRYTKSNNSSEYFEVSILGCRPVDEQKYQAPKHIHGESILGKRKFGKNGGKRRKIKTRKIKTRKIKTRKIKTRKIKTRKIKTRKIKARNQKEKYK